MFWQRNYTIVQNPDVNYRTRQMCYQFMSLLWYLFSLPDLLNFLTLTQLWNAVLMELRGMLPVSASPENLGNETGHYFRSSYGEYPANERSSDMWHKRQYFIFPVYLSWLIPQTSKCIHFISALTILGSPWFILSIWNVPSIYCTCKMRTHSKVVPSMIRSHWSFGLATLSSPDLLVQILDLSLTIRKILSNLMYQNVSKHVIHSCAVFLSWIRRYFVTVFLYVCFWHSDPQWIGFSHACRNIPTLTTVVDFF